MANIIVFCILAVVILGSAVLSVVTKRIMRAATFLLFVLFGIAGLYFLMDYTYLGAAQISIYAGGITILYIFAISMMVSSFTLDRNSGLAVVAFVYVKTEFLSSVKLDTITHVEVPMKQIGAALVGSDKYQYVLPFELISVFLLACIIGGVMIARKEDKK